jgi:hypothetical protein
VNLLTSFHVANDSIHTTLTDLTHFTDNMTGAAS